ncbi:hypothetical protein DL770_007399 [Monosporascus sp. CRB-9-2]|nr:hypothetical protein DL770_007399 [Monosporascus sp. CRB-9-2]
MHGNVEVVRLLLDRKADPTAKCTDGLTPLHYLAKYAVQGEEEIFNLLIGAKADVAATDNDGMTVLHYAGRYGSKVLARLLIAQGVSLESDCDSRLTATYYAALYGSEEVVRILADAGADLERTYGKTGRTALMLAAENGHTKTAQVLINCHANLGARDGKDWTSIQLAAWSGHAEVVELLIEKGSSIEARDKVGRTVLLLAAASGEEQVSKILIDRGANMEARDDDQRTALIMAAAYGYESVVRILLDQKVDITAKAGLERNALHIAAKNGHEAVVQLLMEEGADPTIQDGEGKTAQELAVEHGQNKVERVFEKAAEIIASGTARRALAGTKYQYEALKGSRQLRVLVLQPGNIVEPVRCSLDNVSLDDGETDFEALSYVWGREKVSREIWLPGGRLLVRDNLYSALLRFRHTDKPRTLWIDAICIDQENIPEQGQQVQLMSEIYSRASAVLVWLGKDDKIAQRAFQVMDRRIDSMLDEAPVEGHRKNDKWDSAVASFFKNEWFERAWIFQEVVCSKTAVFYSGIRDVPIKKSLNKAGSANSVRWEFVGRFYELAGEILMLENLPTGFVSVVGPMDQCQKHRNGRGDDKNYFDLLSLLELRRDSKSTMPVDKVFSLLGLSTEGAAGLLLPDYSSSAEQVYTRVAHLTIKSRKDLRVLSAVQQRVEGSQLPSWVPDWQQPWQVKSLVYSTLNPDMLITDAHTPFSTTAGRLAEVQGDGSSDILRLKGKSFARIKVLADFTTDILDFGSNASDKSVHLEEIGFPLGAQYPGTKTSYVNVLYKTITADLNIAAPEKEILMEPSFENFLYFTEARRDFPGAVSARRLFLADNGYIGLAPANAETGYEICLLFGGNVPYVVCEQDQYHRFIGECYCYGIMQGEAMKNENRETGNGFGEEKVYSLR